MGRTTRLSSQFSLLFLCLIYSTTVYADTNVTLDDGDNRIAYLPSSAWTRNPPSTLDYGGSHMLAQTPTAIAIFNFTGTAIYFLSPLWPYHVTTAVSLDSSPPTLVDLVDHSLPARGGGEETVRSQAVWSATRLENTNHILQISVGAGEPYAIVDGLIYTESIQGQTQSSDNTTSESTPIPSSGLSAPSQTGGTTASCQVACHKKLIAGVVIGLVLLVGI